MNPRSLSRKSLLRLPLALTLAAGLMTAGLSGCSEEPPPPPPPKKDPPPPPPPPPPEISIQAMLQEAKADARVTFADSVKFTDENLARAVIALADGFARGDATKLRTVLDETGQTVLATLDASGEWAESTAGIEAVRVVYVGDAADAFTSAASGEFEPADIGKLTASLTEAFKDIPPADLAKAGPVLAAAGAEARGGAKPDLDKLQKDLEAAGIDPATALKIKTTISAAADNFFLDMMGKKGEGEGGGDAPANRGPLQTHAVVLAVQDAKGAFLLGWGFGDLSDALKFSTAATAAVTKPRASDFDTIGLGAFGSGKPPVATEEQPKGEGEKKPDDPAAPEGGDGDKKEPGGPIRKNTPGGPVTIPGSG